MPIYKKSKNTVKGGQEFGLNKTRSVLLLAHFYSLNNKSALTQAKKGGQQKCGLCVIPSY